MSTAMTSTQLRSLPDGFYTGSVVLVVFLILQANHVILDTDIDIRCKRGICENALLVHSF